MTSPIHWFMRTGSVLTYKGKKGYIYFFNYKMKKDDLNWKLAVVGLVPENPREFEFEDSLQRLTNYL